jgi:uncharacterized membrane protein (UPF0182 family)
MEGNLNLNFKKRKAERKKAVNKRRKSIVIMIVVLIIAAFLLLINFLTDWMWFAEVGYMDVFFKELFTKLKFGVPMFLIVALLAELYLRLLKKGYMAKIISHEEINKKKLNIVTNLTALIFSAVISIYFVNALWFDLLQFTNSTKFDMADPIFNLDISFYIFKLEFLIRLNNLLILAIILFFIMTLIYYMILLSIRTPDVFDRDEAEPIEDGKYEPGTFDNEWNRWDAFGIFTRSRQNRSAAAGKKNLKHLFTFTSNQLSVLGILFFVMVASHFVLKQFDLLNVHRGAVYGAGFTDVTITLWVYRLMAVLALAGAVFTTVFIKKKQFRKILILPAVMIAVNIVGVLVAMGVQSIIVSPDEINKESKYLADNIAFTQYAYDIHDVEVIDHPARQNLDAEKISSNMDTVGNIRINDYEPVKTFYNQTQTIRQYYAFNDIDVDRYMLNGEYKQTFMSVREIDKEKISNTWINRHLKYTHGYGVALSQVNKIMASGQPEVIVKDIPPVSAAEEIKLTRPEVYFGELSEDYVIVNTKEDEFDYPDGQENQYTRYEGKAGIKLNPLKRLMFAIREGSLKLLVSTNVNNDSRIIINRDIAARTNMIMPYLSYEDDPYAVVVDGRLVWVIDAYTTSSYYPYSEPYEGKLNSTNYIRNSVKVVVDAYNGDVDYYIADDTDPIALTYSKIFPGVFKSMDDMPEEIRGHMRYPNTLFEIQADVYAKYHMNDVKVFYQNEDIWEVSHEIYGVNERKIIPNYYILNLPGEEDAEFVSMLPYSPKSKQNMTGLLITRSDGDSYGDLLLFRFPKNRTIYGPMQIEAQIDQNTEISQDFSLWSQSGSKYSRGNLFVVPIDDSLMYIEPIYLEASNTAIPEVKRVIVAYGEKIAYERTLAEAMNSLFGEGAMDIKESIELEPGQEPGKETEGDGLSVDALIKKADQAFKDAQKAREEGRWTDYGKALDDLEDALNKLAGGKKSQSTNTSDSAKTNDGAGESESAESGE